MCKFLQCTTENIQEDEELTSHEISLSEHPSIEKLLNEAKTTADIEVIGAFANKLEAYGKENNIESFKHISTKLSSAVDSFDIGECNIILALFTTTPEE